MPRTGRPISKPDSKLHNVNLSSSVWEYLTQSGSASAAITKLVEDEMEKQEKQHYYAILKNDQGGSMNGPHGTSINQVVSDTRAHYSGWKVEIYRVEINGERTLVKEFQQR